MPRAPPIAMGCGRTRQLEELAREYADKRFTMREWIAARDAIEARMEPTKKRLSRLSRTAAIDPYVGKAASSGRSGATIDLNRQRAIVSALLDRAVIVRPAVRVGRPSTPTASSPSGEPDQQRDDPCDRRRIGEPAGRPCAARVRSTHARTTSGSWLHAHDAHTAAARPSWADRASRQTGTGGPP